MKANKKMCMAIVVLVCVTMMLTMSPETWMAENVSGATTSKVLSFKYAYDCQRWPAYPKMGDTVDLTGFTNPLIAEDTFGTTTEGEWKLTPQGKYVEENYESTILQDVVTSTAELYDMEDTGIEIYELTNGSEHVAYGVLIVRIGEGYLYIGDTWGGGGGYFLSDVCYQEDDSFISEALGDFTDIDGVSSGNLYFRYAYDCQRNPAFPLIGEKVRLSWFTNPLIGDGTFGTTPNGSWKLIKLGAYEEVEVESTRLGTIVDRIAELYEAESSTVDVYELMDGDTHIAYGVLCAKIGEGYLYVGDTLGGSGGGYFLSDITCDEGDVIESETIGDLTNIDGKKPSDSQNTETKVEVTENLPIEAENISGMEDVYDTIVTDNNKGYTQEDKAVVDAGGSSLIYLKVNPVETETVGLLAIEEKATEDGYTRGTILDLSVYKDIIPAVGDTTTTKLIELPYVITVIMDIPVDEQNMKEYVIYRYHEGGVDVITTTPNSDGEYIELSNDKKSITLHIKKFSEYAIGYTEEQKDTNPDEGNSTLPGNLGDNQNGNPGDNDGGNNGGNSGTEVDTNNEDDKTSTTDKKNNVPNTGDAFFLRGWVTFILFGIGTIVYGVGKKRS